MKDLARSVVYIGVFAVPFIPLIIANSMFFPFITGKNFTFRILVEIILAAWVILALYEPAFRPRFSWILTSLVALLGVMFVANWLGEFPLKSFWSNFERMEGYVTLVHFVAYAFVVGTVLNTEKLWLRFFNTSIIAALILAFYAFAQLSGSITINQGGWRLDGTLGNSAYMAIYMLFHVFMAAFMFSKAKTRNWRIVYGLLVLLFIYLLIQTATRGTIIGLVGGASVAALYIALFTKGNAELRKYAAVGVTAIVLIVGGFVAFKDSTLIQSNPYLQRIASISFHEAETRFSIWTMAFEGVKERPVLGWGQGNYNYVFNKYYDPGLYAQEQWFDRVHNIVLDWLIAGGVVGTIAYFSIFVSSIYYLFVRPVFMKDESFTVVEQGLILGLFAGYLFHNFFVFDNIVSYIFFAVFLGFIHSRVATPISTLADAKIARVTVDQIAVPVVSVALIAGIYFINVPSIQAGGDIIDAFRSQSPEEMMFEFEEALARGSFGDQEIREQMTRQVQNIFRAPSVPPELKQEYFKQTEAQLLQQAEEKPGDARIHVFIASFYRMTNNIGPAEEQLAIARSLSPNKQQIIFEQGIIALQKQDPQAALAFFKEAYDLAPAYREARIFYAVGALYAGADGVIEEVVYGDEGTMTGFARNDLALQAARAVNDYELLEKIFQQRIEDNPDDPQTHVNLAVIYQETDRLDDAVSTLESAIETIPAFEEQGTGFIEDLKAGRTPGQPEVTVNPQP